MYRLTHGAGRREEAPVGWKFKDGDTGGMPDFALDKRGALRYNVTNEC